MNDKLDEPLDENEKRRLEMKSYIGCLVNVKVKKFKNSLIRNLKLTSKEVCAFGSIYFSNFTLKSLFADPDSNICLYDLASLKNGCITSRTLLNPKAI